jgi:hypothetical protein
MDIAFYYEEHEVNCKTTMKCQDLSINNCDFNLSLLYSTI